MTKRYDTYKDSGVQWLGEIPGHWNCVQFRKLFKIIKNIAGEEGYDVLSVTQNGLKVKDIKSNQGQIADDYSNYQFVEKGDFAMNHMDLLTGYIGISSQKGVTSPDYRVFRNVSKDSISEYYLFIFQLCYKRKIFFGLGQGVANKGRWRLPANNLNKFYLPLPTLEEQKSISLYLDDKCGKIDEWLDKKQKEVELLGEMKQRVIADAVSRGLNPNVKMKQTGVFWWKETPEHWGKIRLGYILQKMNRQRKPNSELLVCTNKGKVTKRGETKIGLIADSEEIYQGVEEGDLLIHGMDTWHGAIAVSSYKGMCTPVVHVCTSKENLYFVAYYMQVMAYSKIFKLISNGVRQNTSDFRSWAKVDKIPIMLPPKQEQDSIVSYISDKTAKIEKLIANINKEIEGIKEYKQRLISDVVTGQIKVC